MLTKSSRPSIFNFTHVYEAYEFLQGEEFQWIDCTQIEGTDCYCDQEAERRLKRLMTDLSLHTLHWIDSGDYHYLSKLWTDRIQEPFSLVVLDHHPDMQAPMFGQLLSCGSWVREALEQNPMLQEVWLIGVDDKLEGEIQGFCDRVKLIPESRLLTEEIGKIVREINIGYPIYLSIDKDVMSPNECTTNWDQGSMTWQQLTAILTLMGKHQVLGIDICGEEPKILTESVYCLDTNLNAEFNESLYNYIIGKESW